MDLMIHKTKTAAAFKCLQISFKEGVQNKKTTSNLDPCHDFHMRPLLALSLGLMGAVWRGACDGLFGWTDDCAEDSSVVFGSWDDGRCCWDDWAEGSGCGFCCWDDWTGKP